MFLYSEYLMQQTLNKSQMDVKKKRGKERKRKVLTTK